MEEDKIIEPGRKITKHDVCDHFSFIEVGQSFESYCCSLCRNQTNSPTPKIDQNNISPKN